MMIAPSGVEPESTESNSAVLPIATMGQLINKLKTEVIGFEPMPL